MLTILAKLLKVLNSEQSPGQIAAAISLSAIVGLTPLMSLHNLLIVFLVLFFRVNLTIFLVAWPLFTILGMAISPLSESVGESILHAPALLTTWESFYNTVIGRWSNFYYSGVIGSLVIAIVVAILGYPLSRILVVKYRDTWMKKLEKLRIVKLLSATKIWQLYQGQ
ncbi:TIGR03546 family protein [Aliikangiella sp. G2MR2-5]|uniref:TIGR03546 family protein n=1 Tax=Aliikangiella sp. G2MR2-5 TaxID=2788943 RepID=UPI0018AC254C|nr:TIGR03546 family protein [Aliikangiella sp. G2MR2-5]